MTVSSQCARLWNHRHVAAIVLSGDYLPSALEGSATLMDDICEAVEACSIPVEQVHAESGPGQFELATAPGVGDSRSNLNVLVQTGCGLHCHAASIATMEDKGAYLSAWSRKKSTLLWVEGKVAER